MKKTQYPVFLLSVFILLVPGSRLAAQIDNVELLDSYQSAFSEIAGMEFGADGNVYALDPKV
ncbi:MAG TPA: hypothetical protein VGL10_05445, partial [Gammaproteobacteria bacterium]